MKDMKGDDLDSNKFSIGIHFFKVLVQIHYSHSPCPLFSHISHHFIPFSMNITILPYIYHYIRDNFMFVMGLLYYIHLSFIFPSLMHVFSIFLVLYSHIHHSFY